MATFSSEHRTAYQRLIVLNLKLLKRVRETTHQDESERVGQAAEHIMDTNLTLFHECETYHTKQLCYALELPSVKKTLTFPYTYRMSLYKKDVTDRLDYLSVCIPHLKKKLALGLKLLLLLSRSVSPDPQLAYRAAYLTLQVATDRQFAPLMTLPSFCYWLPLICHALVIKLALPDCRGSNDAHRTPFTHKRYRYPCYQMYLAAIGDIPEAEKATYSHDEFSALLQTILVLNDYNLSTGLVDPLQHFYLGVSEPLSSIDQKALADAQAAYRAEPTLQSAFHWQQVHNRFLRDPPKAPLCWTDKEALRVWRFLSASTQELTLPDALSEALPALKLTNEDMHRVERLASPWADQCKAFRDYQTYGVSWDSSDDDSSDSDASM